MQVDAPEWHLNSFTHFLQAYGCEPRQTDIDRQTDRQTMLCQDNSSCSPNLASAVIRANKYLICKYVFYYMHHHRSICCELIVSQCN